MDKPIIASLGGHSALEIFFGAKKMGMQTLVVIMPGRDKTYTEYFRNLVDNVITVSSFKDLTGEKTTQTLKEKNCIFIPHRYVQVYCDLYSFETKFPIPIFGNKFLLKYEERTGIHNQYMLLYNAFIDHPIQFKNPQDIDRLAIVKVSEAERHYERAFFFANNYKEYKIKSDALKKNGDITDESLSKAIIEEYLIGALVNFNFFYSPVSSSLQLIGTDMRRQTNIDGLIRIPAGEQKEIEKYINPTYIESGHIAVTVKESLLEQAFHIAEKLLTAAKDLVPPGIIGPFALQTAVIPGPPKEKIIVYDLSLRIPGSPGIAATPYSQYHFGEPVSMGQRISMEIIDAVKSERISKITT